MRSSTGSAQYPARAVLEGVPRISFDTGESLSFPAALKSCLQFLGAGAEFDYTYLTGVSGAAFGLHWSVPRWHYAGDITDYACNSSWCLPLDRTFRAVGYAYELLTKEASASGEEGFRQSILESIAGRRCPVIATGVVGPPACCIVTGYDDGGDVLIGWSLFQGMAGHDSTAEFEPSGCFRRRGWLTDTGRLILVGETRERPAVRTLDREALEWALDLMWTPRVGERHSGLAAYSAWAQDLLRDEDFPADDLETLLSRLDCHCHATAVVAEGRWHAAQFLKRIGQREVRPREALSHAAECLVAAHRKALEIWDLQGGFDPHSEATARRLAAPEVRHRIAALVLEARASEDTAARYIEQAIESW